MFVLTLLLNGGLIEPNYVALPIPTCPLHEMHPESTRKFVIKVTVS